MTEGLSSGWASRFSPSPPCSAGSAWPWGGAVRRVRATAPIRGDSRSGSWPGSGLVALVAMSVAHALDVPGLTISFSPLAFPSIPLLPVVGILIALAPAFAAPNPIAPPDRRRTASPKRASSARARRAGNANRRSRTSRASRHDHASTGSPSPIPRRNTPRCTGSASTYPKASCASSWGRRGRASQPCCGRSTGWSRTSAAERWLGRSRSTGGAPRTTGRAIWPMWSASSARTRWPASSPRPSRTSWPTRWRTWGCPPMRCAAGWRTRSTCWACRTCATDHCGRCRAVSSSAWRSGRC